MPRPSPPSVGAEAPPATKPDCKIAVGSHGKYIPTATPAFRRCVNATVSKAAW